MTWFHDWCVVIPTVILLGIPKRFDYHSSTSTFQNILKTRAPPAPTLRFIDQKCPGSIGLMTAWLVWLLWFRPWDHQFKRVFSYYLKLPLRLVFLQETSLFLRATQQTLAVKPRVFLSQHCSGHLMIGTCHQVSIKSVSLKDHFWSYLMLQRKWKVSTSVQQKTKLMQQLPLCTFMFLVRTKRVINKLYSWGGTLIW